uniref:Uncharacterized protein n=1 Tax=Scleropages formosus TaxID=113540 RepID=A0A8C9TQ70_SCLFO
WHRFLHGALAWCIMGYVVFWPPWPPVLLSLGVKSNTVGTALAFSCRCWSSQRSRKQSGAKCLLHRKEYLLGTQFSRLTARSHLARRLGLWIGNLGGARNGPQCSQLHQSNEKLLQRLCRYSGNE